MAMKKVLSIGNALIAIAAGTLVLLGYLLPKLLGGLRQMLVQWAIILAAFALLLGIFNLASVHWKRARGPKGTPNRLYSAVLLLSLVLTILLVSYTGPTSIWSVWLVTTFQVPVETSLLAVLAIVLVFAAARMLNRHLHWASLLFLGAAVLVLLGTTPLPIIGEIAPLSKLHRWLAGGPALAGARGLLLGVALGTIATGLRILMGVDRPYGD
jgi:hypothetical protein